MRAAVWIADMAETTHDHGNALDNAPSSVQSKGYLRYPVAQFTWGGLEPRPIRIMEISLSIMLLSPLNPNLTCNVRSSSLTYSERTKAETTHDHENYPQDSAYSLIQ